jgi:hypothetical protein
MKEIQHAMEQMDHIRAEKLLELYGEEFKQLGELSALIHPSKITSETIWRFAYRYVLQNQKTDPDDQDFIPLQLQSVKAATAADLTTILVKCSKKPVGMYLSAFGRDLSGSRDRDPTEEEFYEEAEAEDEVTDL